MAWFFITCSIPRHTIMIPIIMSKPPGYVVNRVSRDARSPHHKGWQTQPTSTSNESSTRSSARGLRDLSKTPLWSQFFFSRSTISSSPSVNTQDPPLPSDCIILAAIIPALPKPLPSSNSEHFFIVVRSLESATPNNSFASAAMSVQRFEEPNQFVHPAIPTTSDHYYIQKVSMHATCQI